MVHVFQMVLGWLGGDRGPYKMDQGHSGQNFGLIWAFLGNNLYRILGLFGLSVNLSYYYWLHGWACKFIYILLFVDELPY